MDDMVGNLSQLQILVEHLWRSSRFLVEWSQFWVEWSKATYDV